MSETLEKQVTALCQVKLWPCLSRAAENMEAAEACLWNGARLEWVDEAQLARVEDACKRILEQAERMRRKNG